MVTVFNRLKYDNLTSDEVGKVFRALEGDGEVQSYLRMANVMAVDRMGYNDHRPVHSKIVSGIVQEIFKRIGRSREPSIMVNGVCDYTPGDCDSVMW
jgi:metal-dependent HD superfamily phosphatase/phosphodiesterase